MVANSEDRIILKFQPKQNESSSDLTSLSNSNERDDVLMIIWNVNEIKDFVRRLGFSDSSDQSANMKSFMELFEVYYNNVSFFIFNIIFFFQTMNKIQNVMESLHEMGHPDYSDTIFPYECDCSTDIFELKKLVSYNNIIYVIVAICYRYQSQRKMKKNGQIKLQKIEKILNGSHF